MRWIFQFIALFGTSIFLNCEAQINISLLGHLDYQALHQSDINSIWGYSDGDGNEYALVGVTGNFTDLDSSGGISIVDVTDPTNPVEVFFLHGTYCQSYEAQVWGDRAYITSRCGGGLRVIDLSPLPEETELNVVTPDLGLITAHTTFIDEAGRLYVNGGNLAEGGTAMFDLSLPDTIVFDGEWAQTYVHDCYARGDTLYTANIFDGTFSVLDVADPGAPVLLGFQYSPGHVTHNVWLDDGGTYLFTTDEHAGEMVAAFDVSDLSDIQLADGVRSDTGAAIPHNTYWLNDYLVTSYYTYGVVIYDALRPDNLVEVGHFDTSPITNCGYCGAWGVYPFLPSGRLILSDMEEGLFILEPDYQRACWLEGTVLNGATSMPLSNASIAIVSGSEAATSDVLGHYATGTGQSGLFDVVVSAYGFLTQTISAVQLTQGEITFLDIELMPIPEWEVQGMVVEIPSGAPIVDAKVILTSQDHSYSAMTAADGTFLLQSVQAGNYALDVGHWGHHQQCAIPVLVESDIDDMEILMELEFRDDFDMDLGWTIVGLADTGVWMRAEPIGTIHMGLNSNASADVEDDCGAMAFVTGNGHGGIQPDVDDVGVTTTELLSPRFDASELPDPHLRYDRWFSDVIPPLRDDTMFVLLTNGSDTVVVERVFNGMPGNHHWRQSVVRIGDHLVPTGDMQMIFRIVDQGQENRLEAGVDRFEVLASAPIGIHEQVKGRALAIIPNPSSGMFNLFGCPDAPCTITVIDLQGRIVFETNKPQGTAAVEIQVAAPTGCYSLLVDSAEGRLMQRLFLVR